MTNSTSITMIEQDKQEIIRGAQSYYRDDKALINHSYVEYMQQLMNLSTFASIIHYNRSYNHK
jgi:hypothetical protein